MGSVIVKREQITNPFGLWNLFPCIEVPKTKLIPRDYPGLMGVPITALEKLDYRGTDRQFDLLDTLKPSINGKNIYQRIIVRNLHPDLSDEVNINELLEKFGSDWRLERINTNSVLEKEDELWKT